jgi:alkanesulfonate monooxygenase SsuD/methylene tetrahydromethanopterin reductase-like flavin-dependent oxidoreductase (luciferase family)
VTDIDVGVRYVNRGDAAGLEYASALAEAVDDCGIESVWVSDRAVVPAHPIDSSPYSADGDLPDDDRRGVVDPFVWLSWFAARTGAVQLGTAAIALPLWNPVRLALQAASLAGLAPGRLLLGVGAGWMPEEFEIMGACRERRGRTMDAAIASLRRAWAGQSLDADHDLVAATPRPGAIPVVVCGHSLAAARRAGRLGDGFFPTPATRARELVPTMRAEAERSGRDADAVPVTVGWSPGDVDAMSSIVGVADRVVLPAPRCSPDELRHELARTVEQAVVAYRRVAGA